MASKLNRRDFLKGVGLATMSAGARLIPTLPVTDTPEAPEDPTFEGLDQIINTGPVNVLAGPPCAPLSLVEYAGRLGVKLVPWVGFDGVECDCPLCRELSGKSWVEPSSMPEPEYDCDYYMPISEGVSFEDWINPATGESHRTIIEWFDHGLHTNFMANGHYLGQALSIQVDPSNYLHSIWTAGMVALRQIMAEREGLWSTET